MANRWLVVVLIVVALVFCSAQFFGNPFLRKDSAGSVNLYNPPNVMQMQVRNGYVILPVCPTDTSTLEFGAICRDAANQVIVIRSGSGLVSIP